MNSEHNPSTIPGIALYRNQVYGDERGSLYQLAPNIDTNEHFPTGIKNLIAVDVHDLLPRGGHYHNRGEDDILTLRGAGLWHFVDLREGQRASYACIVGMRRVEAERFADIDQFVLGDGKGLPHLHIPIGVYHTVWSVGSEPLLFVEAKTDEYNEDFYVRMPFADIPELVQFKEARSLVFTKEEA